MKTRLLVMAALGAVGAIGVAQAQDAARGQKMFEECAACHALKAGDNGAGPSLAGVLGQQAGQHADFRYSPALRRSGIVWSAVTLDEFVADPQKMAPGNRMPYSGMPDAKSRADLVAYLLTVMK